MLSGKATHEQLKRHNRQLLLRAVYSGLASSRASLAQVTGLAKPTVSDLIGELIEEGFLVEGEYGESGDSGGKRPRLLEFVPDARQVIGISLDNTGVSGVLKNLGGRDFARHYARFGGARGEEAVEILQEVINGLVAQLDAPLLCIGIGIPGLVDSEAGVVREYKHLVWYDMPLVERLSEQYDVPIYIGNDTELAALAQAAYDQNLVTILIDGTVEVGMSFGGAVYHRGSDIGELRLRNQRLESLLSWESVRSRIKALNGENGDSYLHIRYTAARGDRAALQVYDELAAQLAEVVAWVIGLLRPTHISLVGPIVDLGEDLIQRVIAKTEGFLPRALIEPVKFSLAEASNLSAVGAITQALHNELGIL